MSDSNSFTPSGESAYDLSVEYSNMYGALLSAIGYGILFTMTLQTLLLFFKLPKSKIPWRLVIYVSVTFILASIGFGGHAKFIQMAYIDDRNIPGGPNAFIVKFYSIPANMMSFTAYTIMSWMADGLVLWRFTLIWSYDYRLSIFPGLMFMGSIASSIALIISVTRSGDTFWSARSLHFGIVYWSLSLSLNIILTGSIVTRIRIVRHRVRKLLGSEHSAQYLSVTAMLIESAALYAIWSLVFLICYARNTPLQNILLPPLGQIEGIAPVLILFRVAQGRAWSQNMANATSNEVLHHGRRLPLSQDTVSVEESRNVPGRVNISITTEAVTQWDDRHLSLAV